MILFVETTNSGYKLVKLSSFAGLFDVVADCAYSLQMITWLKKSKDHICTIFDCTFPFVTLSECRHWAHWSSFYRCWWQNKQSVLRWISSHEKLLPIIKEFSDYFTFQQHSALGHRAQEPVDLLKHQTSSRRLGIQ